jgi:hypothetical protein
VNVWESSGANMTMLGEYNEEQRVRAGMILYDVIRKI